MNGLTPRGETIAVLVGILIFLVIMSIVGGLDVASDLPNQ